MLNGNGKIYLIQFLTEYLDAKISVTESGVIPQTAVQVQDKISVTVTQDTGVFVF